MPPERFLRQLSGAVGERGPIQAPGHRLLQLAAGESVIAAKGGQIFPAGEAGIESQLLRNPSQSRAGLGRIGRRAEDRDAPRIGDDAAHDGADERALAGAVRPEQAQTFAGAQFQRNAIDGRELAEALDQRNDFERDRFGEGRRGFGQSGGGGR